MLNGDDIAQSEVIGTILLVAVVVISVTTYGAFYLGNQTSGESEPSVDFDARVTTTSVNITHLGGDSIERDELTVTVRNSSNTQRFSAANGMLLIGDADSRFELGEEWRTTNVIFSANERVHILIVHEPSNTVLYDGRTRVTA